MNVSDQQDPVETRAAVPRLRRSLKGRLVLGLMGLLLGGVICEIAIRITGLDFPLVTYVYDDKLPLRKPYGTVRCVNDIIRVYRLNNYGFHDEDWFPEEKTKRFLFLGDSMLEGAQVPQADGFSQRVEGQLKQVDESIDVLNAGVTGTGTADQYVLWNEYLRHKIEIDHIVLCFFFGNDLENNHRELGHPPVRFGAYLDSEGAISVNRVPEDWLKRTIRRLCEYSAAGAFAYRTLYRLRRMRAHALKEGTDVNEGGHVEHGESMEGGDPMPSDFLSESIAGTLKLIQNWAEELRQEGVGFSVVLLGNPVDEPLTGFVTALRSGLAETNGRVLSVRVPDEELLRFQSFDGKTIGHYNQAGHAWVGDQIANWLREGIE